MGWTWPSWTAIGLGVLLAILGFILSDTMGMMSGSTMAGAGMPLLVGGLILLAAGLHGLQGAYTACCDNWCGDGGCGCGHCSDCKGGTCCGHCGCPNEVSHEHGPGGHQH